jgi:hypothetical protein
MSQSQPNARRRQPRPSGASGGPRSPAVARSSHPSFGRFRDGVGRFERHGRRRRTRNRRPASFGQRSPESSAHWEQSSRSMAARRSLGSRQDAPPRRWKGVHGGTRSSHLCLPRVGPRRQLAAKMRRSASAASGRAVTVTLDPVWRVLHASIALARGDLEGASAGSDKALKRARKNERRTGSRAGARLPGNRAT